MSTLGVILWSYFRVVDADASVVDIENYLQATSEIAKTTLRSVLGKAELDTLLSERERLNEDLLPLDVISSVVRGAGANARGNGLARID